MREEKILDKLHDEPIQHMSTATVSLFTDEEQETSNSNKKKQSETKERTKAIQTPQMFDRHHYGTTEAHRTRPYN
jgi:2-C-methyl-D-erythritol 4-phosphate cytidylyltransferase